MGSASYTYRAAVREWVDGDTVEVDIDLGFAIHKIDRVRLHGVNCPETHSSDQAEKAKGKAAKAFSESLAPAGALIVLRSFKSGEEKYGRFLADVITDDGRDVAVELIRAGHGQPYDGGKRSPTPRTP